MFSDVLLIHYFLFVIRRRETTRTIVDGTGLKTLAVPRVRSGSLPYAFVRSFLFIGKKIRKNDFFYFFVHRSAAGIGKCGYASARSTKFQSVRQVPWILQRLITRDSLVRVITPRWYIVRLGNDFYLLENADMKNGRTPIEFSAFSKIIII